MKRPVAFHSLQVQFDEVNPENVFQNRKLFSAIRLHVRMRAGHPAEVRHQMTMDYTNRLSRVTGVPIVDHDRHCRDVLRGRHGIGPGSAGTWR